MIAQYLKERAKWIKFGKPLRKQEEMDELFSICLDCPNFKKRSEDAGSCGVCGCHIKKTGNFLNKIAWGTTRCPLPEPKWVESESRFAKDVTITQEDLEKSEKEHAKEAAQNHQPPKKRPCNCGRR